MSATQAAIWTVVLYFLPAMVAYARRSGWRVWALVATLLFGWTIVGWFVAWFFAFHKRERHWQRDQSWPRSPNSLLKR